MAYRRTKILTWIFFLVIFVALIDSDGALWRRLGWGDSLFLRTEAVTVRYHGSVYRGLHDDMLRSGGQNFSVYVSTPVFSDISIARDFLWSLLSDHVHVTDESGISILYDSDAYCEEYTEDWVFHQKSTASPAGGLGHLNHCSDNKNGKEDFLLTLIGEEAYNRSDPVVVGRREVRKWRIAVQQLLETSEILISSDGQTLTVNFSRMPSWELAKGTALVVIPCLPLAFFEQIESLDIGDTLHHCLDGDSFMIRRQPFLKTRGSPPEFLAVGSPVEIPIEGDGGKRLEDQDFMNKRLRLVQGASCLHSRDAKVRSAYFDVSQQVFLFTLLRGGTYSLCFTPFKETMPFLHLKLLRSLVVAGPEGLATDPPQLQAGAVFSGTFFGTNLTDRDTAVLSDGPCIDLVNKSTQRGKTVTQFLELMFLNPSRMIFEAKVSGKEMYYVCYHRYLAASYVRVTTLQVEEEHEDLAKGEKDSLLIDQDVAFLTPATVQQLRVQSNGNLVLNQSLTVVSYFFWSGGTITGKGLLNLTGYSRATTEGFEVRHLVVPLYNYGDLTMDVQQLLLERSGKIHNYGNLTITVSSMGSEGIGSIISSSAERNIIINYPGGVLRLVVLEKDSFALINCRIVLEGGVMVVSGRLTAIDVLSKANSIVEVKGKSILTTEKSTFSGELIIEENAEVKAKDSTLFDSCTITGEGVLQLVGDGVTLNWVNVFGEITVLLHTPPEDREATIVTIGLWNTNQFGPGTVLVFNFITVLSGGSAPLAQLGGVTVIDLDSTSFMGFLELEVTDRLLVYQAKGETAPRSGTGVGSYRLNLVVREGAFVFLIDAGTASPGGLLAPSDLPRENVEEKALALHKSRCVRRVYFVSLQVDGTVFLSGCLHTIGYLSMNGSLKSLKDESDWEVLLSSFCSYGLEEHVSSLCSNLQTLQRESGYSGLLSWGDGTITDSGVISIDELVSARGTFVILAPVKVQVLHLLIMEATSRWTVEKGGVIETPLFIVYGLLDVFEPMATEIKGNVHMARNSFVRLRGVPQPCRQFFQVSGELMVERGGHEAFHCIEGKPSEFNEIDSFSSLPSTIPCTEDMYEYMRQHMMVNSPFRTRPFLLSKPLSLHAVVLCCLASVATVPLVLYTVCRVLKTSFKEFRNGFYKPSPLQLTLSWDEFKSNSMNYFVLVFYSMNIFREMASVFHPSLPVPFPYVTFVCLRSVRLLLPYLVCPSVDIHRISIFVLIWIGMLVVSNIFRTYDSDNSKPSSIYLGYIRRYLRGCCILISVGFSTFFTYVVSAIGDGVMCFTLLKDEPTCAPLRQRPIFFPIECFAFFSFFVAMSWVCAGWRHVKEADSHLQMKASFTIVSNLLSFLQVCLWKIFAYYPLMHLTASAVFCTLNFWLTLVSPPTPFQNVNKLILSGRACQFPMYVVLFIYQLCLYFGWITFCSQGTWMFFLAYIAFLSGALVSFLYYIVHVRLPDGSVGDPLIDALRRSIAQICSRINEIKKTIPDLVDPIERENALNAVSHLRVDLLEKQDRFQSDVQKLLYPFYFIQPPSLEVQAVTAKHDEISSPSSHDVMSPSNSNGNFLSQDEMENFSCGPPLGHGSYGTVYLGILSTGKLVAVKYISLATTKTEVLQSVKSEVQMMTTLKHPNIIRYYGAHSMGGTMMIFMEFAVGGSLASIVKKFLFLTEAVMQMYTAQILSGLLYLHRKGIVHRDIKGENILIDGDGVSKLADFGCSKALVSSTQAGCESLVGSPFWMAPEVIRSEGYGTKADIWSVGCTVVEMLNGGEPPWKSMFDNAYSAMFYVGSTSDIPSIPEDTSDACRSFLHRCFERDVEKRASAEELLRHEWLAEVVESANSINFRDMRPTSMSGDMFDAPFHRDARGSRTLVGGASSFPDPSSSSDKDRLVQRIESSMLGSSRRNAAEQSKWSFLGFQTSEKMKED